ncbi:MAG: flippase-like domain-containing protein [Lentisphaeria bacterium]|nr:flippase-like domain-containing protein [Lentisphaeria bacterium]
MAKEQGKSSRFLQTSIRLIFAVAIIGGLIWFRREQLQQCLNSFDYLFVIPSILFYLITQIIGSWRWCQLARLQKFDISMFEAFSLTMQGNFFSLVIPGGAIGGDVAKMGLLAKRRQPGTRGEAIFSVFMDRVVGMLALFALAILFLLTFFTEISNVKIPYLTTSTLQIKLLVIGLILLCLAGIFAGIAIFFHKTLRKIPGVGKLMDWMDAHFNKLVSRVTAMADLYAKYPGKMFLLVVVSIFFIHIFSTLPLCFLLAGTGTALDCRQILLVMTAVTIGNISGLIPLTPGGIGLRDLTTIAILGAVGVGQGAGETAQLMSTGLGIILNLCGGLFFALDGGRTSNAVKRL